MLRDRSLSKALTEPLEAAGFSVVRRLELEEFGNEVQLAVIDGTNTTMLTEQLEEYGVRSLKLVQAPDDRLDTLAMVKAHQGLRDLAQPVPA